MANAVDRLLADAEGRARRRAGSRGRPVFAGVAGEPAPDVREVMRENAELRRANAQLRGEVKRLELEGGRR